MSDEPGDTEQPSAKRAAAKPWSTQDDYDLQWAQKREMAIGEIATFLERNADEVRARIAELNREGQQPP
jgi:hypothetical protein